MKGSKTMVPSSSELLVGNEATLKMVATLEGSPSTGDASQESLPEVECKLTNDELGAELLINDGSQSPSISPIHTMDPSSSEDESKKR
jgi:hypothetical protein